LTTRYGNQPAQTNEAPALEGTHRFYVRVGSKLEEPPHRSIDSDTGLRGCGEEPLWIADEYHEAVQAAGLGRFNAMMQTDQGRCMRALAVRENWKIQLAVRGRRRTLFLKKHHVRTWWSRLQARFGLSPRSAGREEARNVRRLESAGIPCMELAAFGEKLGQDGLLESFLLTPELEGFTQMDDFLRARFQPLTTQHGRRRNVHLRQLISRVAATARQFHEAGFNHRDLYCCHFFVRETTPGDFEIRLIDLQRIQYRERLRRRWLVKDLAQLAYSAPRDRIKCTQKMAFIRQYLGVRKLRPEHKRLIREVLAKQHAMERKLGLIA
jgi:heptose I phosphotransferase